MVSVSRLAIRVQVAIWLALVCAFPVGAQDATSLVGWRRDGRGAFAEARPPMQFDGVTGQNIRWKTKLPNWSNSSPIVMAGRVFLVAEPWDGYSPWLLCVDAVSGKELWRRELDAAACLPAAEQESVRSDAREAWRRQRLAEQVSGQAYQLYIANHKRFEGSTPPADLAGQWNGFEQALDAIGYKLGPVTTTATRNADFPDPLVRVVSDDVKRRIQRVSDLDLGWCQSWRSCGTWNGLGYPTPCGDGKRVFVHTLHNLFACYDVDGNLVWQRRMPRPRYDQLPVAMRARVPAEGWPSAWPYSQFQTSPILADVNGDGMDLVLLSNSGQMFRCLDADTGDERWAVPTPVNFWHIMAVPSVARVDGESVMVTVGGGNYPPDKGDEVIRIRDGASVGYLPGGATGKFWGTGAIVGADDVVLVGDQQKRGECRSFHEPEHAVAYRMTWNADRTALAFTKLWRVPGRSVFQYSSWHDGLLYSLAGVVDLQRGAVLSATPYPVVPRGYCDFGSLLVGDTVCVWDRLGRTTKSRLDESPDRTATFHFFQRLGGGLCGRGTLPINPPDGASALQRVTEEHNWDAWRWMGAGMPWAEGDRLYIRSFDFLYCIAPDVAGTAQDDPKMVAQIQGAATADAVTKFLGSPSAQYRFEAVQQIRRAGWKIEDNLQSALEGLVTKDPYDDLRAEALSNWPADPAVTAMFQKMVADAKEGWFHGPAVSYLMRALPDDQKNAMLAQACMGNRGEVYAVQLLERNATATLKTLVSETRDRAQSGIVVALARAADTPAQRQFATDMAVLALQEPSKDMHALSNLASWIKTLGADAAPVLPAFKGLKIEDAATAMTITDAITEIEAKVAAEKK